MSHAPAPALPADEATLNAAMLRKAEHVLALLHSSPARVVAGLLNSRQVGI